MRKGFIFDMNKCVGCQACVIACQIENHTVQSEPWRRVNTFNAYQHPLLPLFHFSLACNHCEIPLCLENCPARAYSRDELFQTIDHDAGRCIGCRYCAWACPYDAPKFIHARGIVEKCTLCKTRIEEGLKPNCANLCPTGALDFGDIDSTPEISIPGLVEKGVGPGIRIIPLRKSQPQHSVTPWHGDEQAKLYRRLALNSESRPRLEQEWPLVVFTLLASVLFGVLAAFVFKPTKIDPIAFLTAGIAGMMLSVLHLGRKLRAWRALLNLRTSWLSREVGAYLLFLLLSELSFLGFPIAPTGIGAILAGLACLVSIDMVYSIAENRTAPGLHSASAVLTGLLFFSAFSELWWPFVIFSGVKLILYAFEFVRAEQRDLSRIMLSVMRIVVGFILPPVILGSNAGTAAAVALLLVAEFINRSEFYVDLEILSPRRQIDVDILRGTT